MGIIAHDTFLTAEEGIVSMEWANYGAFAVLLTSQMQRGGRNRERFDFLRSIRPPPSTHERVLTTASLSRERYQRPYSERHRNYLSRRDTHSRELPAITHSSLPYVCTRGGHFRSSSEHRLEFVPDATQDSLIRRGPTLLARGVRLMVRLADLDGRRPGRRSNTALHYQLVDGGND
ncbi:hypothetical protein BU24DRAFT_420767, partial [Aaosphaeria arxii CBS 175.79]